MKGLGLSLKALLSHYWCYPWQALFLIAGLCAGVALWSAVQIINGHARASYEQGNQVLGAQAYYWIRAKDETGVSTADYAQLRRQGFREVYPVVQGVLLSAKQQAIPIIATDPIALPVQAIQTNTSATEFNGLAFMQAPYQAWFPPSLARELGVQVNERLLLKDGQTMPPALLQTQTQQGRQVLLDIAPALSLLKRDKLSYLAVTQLSEPEKTRLQQSLPAHLSLVENRQSVDLSQLTQSLHTQLSAMSLLSFAVGLFIVFNAVRFSLWYRRPTLRTLRLMGVSVSTLSLAIAVETLVWSLVGSGLGLALGYLLSQSLLPTVSSSLQSLYGANLGSDIIFQTRTLLWAWLLTLGGLILALALPLWQQLRLPVLPSNTLSTHWRSDQRTRKRLLIAASVLALLAIFIYPLIHQLIQGFILLGMVLLAAAWALPALLASSLKLLEYLLPPDSFKARWLIRDGWAQLPALRTAMMALLLALTANLGVEMLVGSFRTALSTWLEQRIAADFYVQGSSQFKLQTLLDDPNTADWLAAVNERTQISLRWQEHPLLLRGVNPSAPDSQTISFTQALPDALKTWQAADSQQQWVLANEQLHYLAGVKLGDSLALETPQGPVAFQVIGFVHDYGNPYYQLFLPNSLLKRYWPHAEPWNTSLWLKDQRFAAQAEQALLKAGAKAGDWVEQKTIKSLSLSIFDRTFAMTAAMNSLTLWVASIALLAALMAILQERLPEFAQWRALGVNRLEQWLVMSTPLFIWAGITWLAALPLGALLSWILIHKLNVMAFGWSMPLLWSMTPAWHLALLTLGVILFTLVLVAWQLRRKLPQALAQLGAQA
ncbi:FtsX-like permease family protein [Thiolinea disciformis]|uniref:FtsX-like permease family protein n=1 Tax=Thiolinea disciformis TaxID=125614 RepID=UPI00035E19D8|nr:FtsX-like permease family protein [Thiolinea disciformis]